MMSSQNQPIVTQEIRYHMLEAGEVFLVWGIDGWNVVPEENRPVGTEVVDGVMRTPMVREQDTFVATVRVPAGAPLDYGFQIRQTRDGTAISWVWNGNYRATPSEDGVIEVTSNLKLMVTQEIRYRMPEAGEVSLLWGVNGWAALPEETRPVGTIVRDDLMQTPMVREGDTFVVQVQVTAGTTMDYGFLITKNWSGSAIEAVFDREGGYHTTATRDDVVEIQASLGLQQEQTPAGVHDAEPPPGHRDLASTSHLKISLGRRQLPYLRDLLRELVVRDMKLRYKRSVLGILWSLLNPLFQMLVFMFLSRRVLSLDIPNYPSFVFTGVLAWNWFQATVVTTTNAITGNRDLIRRPGFPVAILPVVTVTTNLIHFLLALPVPLLFLLLGGGRLTPTLLALPLVIALQFLLILGLGYLAATANVTFRDTQHLLVVFFMLLFYLTPVFYDANAIPARYQILYRLNPMFHLITAYRAILIQGDLPDFRALLPLAALVGMLLWLGHSVFQRTSYRFVEEL
jgi:lipopolysaccharide transport system permease protein